MTEKDSQSDGWQLDHSGPESYERYLVPILFAPWADRLIEHADLQPGEQVLDVGCGTGIVARRAASQIGEDGVVVGLDMNEHMLEVAELASSERRPAIEWRQGDATGLPFDEESFEAVFSQQMLQFVPDPVAALREMRRVLSPDGRLVLGVLRPLEFNQAYAVLSEALASHVGDEAAEMMRSPFPAWDASDLRSLLAEAGFGKTTTTIDIRSVRYPSAEEFLRREAASSPLAGPLGSLDSTVRDELVVDLGEALGAHTDDRGVVFPIETYMVVAHRSD